MHLSRSVINIALAAGFFLLSVAPLRAEKPAPLQPIPLADAYAKSAKEMKPYAEIIEHTDVKIEMLPIAGGKFTMGSPLSEAKRKTDEGPQHEVDIAPFWMAKVETTWDAYDVWVHDLDIKSRKLAKTKANLRDKAADEYQLSQPTIPYLDMSFGMGRKGYPAICMTQLSARVYCQWLTKKTGRYYRLPTEAEWEYACRAGTTTPYSFGSNRDDLDDYAWHFDNSDEKYQKVGKKKPNPWGLYDMHGNIAEWVLDGYSTETYKGRFGKVTANPLNAPQQLYGRIVRGGSWDDDPEQLRSAARAFSTKAWKQQDPFLPQSVWFHSDALHVGFRIVRPLAEPSAEEKRVKWDKAKPIQDRRNRGFWERKSSPSSTPKK